MPRYKYLILNKNTDYLTLNTYQHKRAVPLNDSIVKRHLDGKATLGVFSGQYSGKFLCFDVDVKDELKAKWTVYKLVDTLIEIGIPSDKIYISLSGNKGYHVDLYFQEPIKNKYLHQLFMITVNKADLLNIDYGQVEYRPNADQQGVKIPLGKNFKNRYNRRCWYVDYEKGLKPIKRYEYILSIEKIDIEVIYDVLERENDNLLKESEAVKIEEDKGYIDSKYEPLDSYKQNIDPEITIETMEHLETNGLTQTGMRHNSILKLAKYYRHLEKNKDECEEMLLSWMADQDTRTYTTKWEDCIKDLKRIVNDVYEKEYSLVLPKKDLSVTYEEMLQIMKLNSKSEKLIAYCMLLHSKRYSLKDGVFYMTFEQMVNASGLSLRTTKYMVPKLAENGIIKIVESNRKKKGSCKKKPNKYRVLIEKETVNENSFKLIPDDNRYIDSFNSCVLYLFDKKELKTLLPRRHYDQVLVNN